MITTKMKKKIFAISAAATETPLNPNRAATSEMMRKRGPAQHEDTFAFRNQRRAVHGVPCPSMLFRHRAISPMGHGVDSLADRNFPRRLRL